MLFFAGGGSLTTDALKKHDAYMDTKESKMEDDIESSGRTFNTFASDWSSCSNVSFRRFVTKVCFKHETIIDLYITSI